MSNIIQLCEERMALSLLGSTAGALIMTISTNKRLLVLVVEDEFLVRTNAAEMIADAGFDVVEAGNADEAIAILEARPEIHVVFTDIQMVGSKARTLCAWPLAADQDHRHFRTTCAQRGRFTGGRYIPA